MATVLYVTAEVLRQVAILAQPVHAASRPRSCSTCSPCPQPSAHFAALGSQGGSRSRRGRACPRACAGVSALRRAGDVKGQASRSPMLVDSHCHLDFPDFAPSATRWWRGRGRRHRPHGDDLDARPPLRRAAGALADALPTCLCSVGTHPHNAAEEPDVTADELVAPRRRIRRCVGDRRGGARLPLRQARRATAAARVPQPHRGGARDRAAAGHPRPRRRRRHDRASSRRRAGRALSPPSCTASRRARASPGRRRARPLRLVLRHPDLQELRDLPRHRGDAAARPAAGRDRRALSRARTPHRGKRNEPAYVGRDGQGAGRDKGVERSGHRARRPRRISSACSPRRAVDRVAAAAAA